jgi:hypothetical protein
MLKRSGWSGVIRMWVGALSLLAPLSLLAIGATLGMLTSSIASAQSAAPAPGDRVRVETVPYVLDLPGIRIEAQRISGSIVSQDDDTVTVKAADQTPRMLPKPGRRFTGVVSSADGGTLWLRRANNTIVEVPRMSLGRLEQADGRRSRGRNALWGLLIGAGVGAAIGAAGSSCTNTPGGFGGVCFGAADSAALGALFFGGIGAAVGVAVPGRERWKEVPLNAAPLP